MLPMDSFRNKISYRVEEADDEVPLNSVMVSVNDEAKMYLARIYDDGAEQVLDEILRDGQQTERNIPAPDETTHNKIQVDDNIIFWSKSGAEPFVGVFSVGNVGIDVQNQNQIGSEPMMDEEEKVNNVDRDVIEAASHFLLRGFDESTVARVIDDACNTCYETEEALTHVRNLIKEDPRLSTYALDEDEESMFGDYRHQLRKRMLGQKEEVVNPALYELEDEPMPGMGGMDFGDPQSQMEIAKIQQEMAELQAEHAKEMEQLQQQLEKLQGDAESLNEKDDVNKGSQTAGFRHAAGPQALSNAISQMEWSGPGSQFDVFLNEITVDGYNMIGSAASSQGSEQSQGQPRQAQVDPAAPASGNPAAPDDVDLAAL